MGKVTKKLIIVCDDKTKEYANYLRQLISLVDDTEDKIRGVEDGSVEAAVWTDKEYLANSAKISSSEHVLFLGDSKVSKSEISSMIVKFDKFGMKYGWLGKRGMLSVDNKMLSEEDYDQFLAYCKEYESEFEKVTIKQAEFPDVESVLSRGAEDNNNNEETHDGQTESDSKKKAKQIAEAVVDASANVLAPAFSFTGKSVAGLINGVSSISAHRKIKDQQYRAATFILYLEGLAEFMEG